jgi:hypothetical protein
MISTPTREERGQAIANASGQVQRIDELLYVVQSQSGNGEYTVNKINGEWLCDCPDNKYRHINCKHIDAVLFSQSIRAEVKINNTARIITPIGNLSACIYCGSNNLKKKGIRKNKTGNLQKFYCNNCHKYMTFNIGFERMKHNPRHYNSHATLLLRRILKKYHAKPRTLRRTSIIPNNPKLDTQIHTTNEKLRRQTNPQRIRHMESRRNPLQSQRQHEIPLRRHGR